MALIQMRVPDEVAAEVRSVHNELRRRLSHEGMTIWKWLATVEAREVRRLRQKQEGA